MKKHKINKIDEMEYLNNLKACINCEQQLNCSDILFPDCLEKSCNIHFNKPYNPANNRNYSY